LPGPRGDRWFKTLFFQRFGAKKRVSSTGCRIGEQIPLVSYLNGLRRMAFLDSLRKSPSRLAPSVMNLSLKRERKMIARKAPANAV